MKKLTFLMLFTVLAMVADGQELITDGGFENSGTYTVTESSTSVLKRVTNIYDPGTNNCQTTFPTTTAAAITAGQWVKKAGADDGVKAIVLASGANGSSNCLNLKIPSGISTAGYDKWNNCVALQKLNTALDNGQKYVVTFWAKQDGAGSNNAGIITVCLVDNTLQAVATTNSLAVSVQLTSNTNWTKYTVLLDVPKFKSFNSTANFATSFLGFGLNTGYSSSLTNYAGVLIDDISIQQYSGTPSTRYVKSGATGTGTSWDNASGSIIDMLNDIPAGEVKVAAGTYSYSTTIPIKDGINLTGGYPANASAGNETIDLHANPTILDGGNARRIITASDVLTPFYNVTTIKGFILQRGKSSYGCAALISLGTVLENCVIRNNNSTGLTSGSAVNMKRNQTLTYNGSIYNTKTSGALINCVIVNNTASSGPGGVYVPDKSDFSIINCVIANNVSTHNDAIGVGGLWFGISMEYAHIQNSIFYNNSGHATAAANNIKTSTTNSLQVVLNNWFDDSTMPLTLHTNSTNNKLKTNISTPNFALPTTFQGAASTQAQIDEINAADWRLKSTSGLIGIGQSTSNIKFPYESMNANSTQLTGRAFSTITTDVMSSTRVINTTIDLGAYEFNPVVVTTAAGTNGTVSATTTVSKGSSVTVTATPNAGCKFSAWTVTSGTAPAPPATSTWTFTPTANCTVSASFSSLLTTASVTYSRTASSLDILVTKPTYTGTLTYKILDVNNNILAQNVTATTQNATLVYSATGLVKNTTYTYKIVAVLDGVEYAPVTLNATTRKYINNSVEVIDDFEDGVQYWSNINSGTVTNGASNTITNGINSSAKCNKLTVNSGAASYVGMKAAIERVEVGPGAFYQYLHVKMYRDATYSNSAGIAVTFIAREDNSAITQVGTPLATVSGINTWVDYVFDLRSASSTNKTLFSFYIRPAELTSGTHAGGFSCYIDDVYLSNSAAPSTGNVTPRIAVSTTSGGTSANTGTVIKVAGDDVTLNATANADNHFVNWTENGTQASVENPYEFTASANRTLVANFEPNTVPVSSGTTNAADITCTTCDVTVAAGAELSVGATKNLKSVTVAAGGKLTITAGNLNVTNGITLESTADATATLVDAYETPTVNAAVKQYVTAGRNWYMSAPLNNTANVSDLNKGNSVQYYEESTGSWKLASGTLTRGRGYIQVANPTQGTTGTVQFAGIVNSGDVSVSLTNNTAGRGFNLVGNPYPSYLNWSLVATDPVNTNLTTGAKMPNGTAWYRTIDYNGKSAWATGVVYAANSVVYNGTSFYKTLTGGTSGATAPTGTGTNISDGSVIWQNEGSVYIFATVSSNGTPSHASVSNLIPPMQAFWVKTNTGGGTLTFKNSMRAHESVSNKLKAPKSQLSTMPFVRLSVSNGASADQVAIYASENASNDFDSADAPKFFNNSGSYQAEIYTLAGNEKLAINSLYNIEEGTTLALGFVTEKENRFSLKATEIANLPANLQLILRDKQTNTEFNLSEGEAYQYGSSATNNADRFSLIFRAKGTTTGFDNKNQSQAIVYTNAAGQIVISAPEKINYAIYNAVGQLIENGVLNTERETRNTKHLAAGVYVVKLNNQSTRVIIK